MNTQQKLYPDDRHIKWSGRVRLGHEYSSMFWPISSATIIFRGTALGITIRSLREKACFYVITAHQDTTAYKIKSDTVTHTIQLVSGLAAGKHSVELYNITNNTSENCIYGFESDGKVLTPDRHLEKKIEFYSNEQFRTGFGKTKPSGDFIVGAYRKLITQIRKAYPDAAIICALGNMDATKSGSVWPGYISQAVTQLNDQQIYTLLFPYITRLDILTVLCKVLWQNRLFVSLMRS